MWLTICSIYIDNATSNQNGKRNKVFCTCESDFSKCCQWLNFLDVCAGGGP